MIRLALPLLLPGVVGCSAASPEKAGGAGPGDDTSTGSTTGEGTGGATGGDTGPSVPPAVRITEIMYHPVAEAAYEDIHEFIELHNAGSIAVDLSGWSMSDGVSYDFGDRVLAPGETLVLTGQPEAVRAQYPDLEPDGVLGQWEGNLADGGERVSLSDAAGELVDSVRYDDASPWPLGPDALGAQEAFLPAEVGPLSTHSGRGRSLQRVSLAGTSDSPCSWRASPLDGMDPGRVDSVSAAAPLSCVEAVSFGAGGEGPLPPDAEIVVTVHAAGPLDVPVLEWFVDDVYRRDEATETVALRDDGSGGDPVAGDGAYTAVLPAQPGQSILRARVWADMGGGTEAAAPREGDPGGWLSHYVAEPRDGETRAYEIFIHPDDWTTMWTAVTPGRVLDCDKNPGWETRVPAVFIHDGTVHDVLVRYQGSRWNRRNGASMTGGPAPGPAEPSPNRALSWSVKFPRYNTLDGRKRISLNKLTQSCPGSTTVVGFQLFEAVGLPVPQTRYARLFVNGEYYNYTLELESPGTGMLERWLEELADADPDRPEEPAVPHLFKSGGCNCDEGPYGWGDERPLTDACGWTALERYEATYERKTHDWAGHEALQALIEDLDAARGSDDATLRTFLADRFDVDAVLSYMAVMNWGVPFDDMFQNHYLLQRQSDGRWLMAPWDLDQDFGGWKGAGASIYMGELGDRDNRSGWWNRIKDSFLRVYRAEYEARLFELNETVLHPDNVIPLVDDNEAQWSLSEAGASPAGPQCDFPGGAQAFRDFAAARHDVVAGIAGGR